MAKAVQDLTFKQIENALEQLGSGERRKLEEKIQAIEWDELVSELRKNARKQGITQKDIDRVCEEVRQELYEKRL